MKDAALTCLNRTAALKQEGSRVRLRILVDRTSIEVFGSDGALSMTSCFVPPRQDHSIELFSEGGTARVVSLKVTPMKSAWSGAKRAQ